MLWLGTACLSITSTAVKKSFTTSKLNETYPVRTKSKTDLQLCAMWTSKVSEQHKILLSFPSATVADECSATIFVAVCKRHTLRAVSGPGNTLLFVMVAVLPSFLTEKASSARAKILLLTFTADNFQVNAFEIKTFPNNSCTRRRENSKQIPSVQGGSTLLLSSFIRNCFNINSFHLKSMM